MDCLDTYPAGIVLKLQVALSAAVTLAACGILTFRLMFRDQKLFDYRGGRAQPQPILSMFILGTTFNMLRMLHAIFLLTETAQSKVVRAVLFDLSWQFGFATFAAYLIGIAAAVFNVNATSNTVVTRSWKLSQSQITKIGFTFIILPVLTNNPISVLIGIYADADNVYLADLFTRLLYSLWGFYCICLSSCILYAGYGLTKLLDSHIRTVVDGRRHDVFKTGRIKVRMIMTASCLCLSCFIVLVLVYMIWKPLTFSSVVFNICIAVVWNFAGPIATFFIEITFLIDPKMLKAPTFSATGSSSFGQKTEESTVDTTQRGSFINTQFQGTRFSQHGHELKIYNAGRSSMTSDAKYLMMQQC
ncbi:unnamed protein product [Umbelopsis sp. WA50703]